MYQNKGFTLIELLVAVLIIGVLAAVAVPQYQKAVAKSRFTQIVTAAKSLAEAESVYYMANGAYATELAQLDVTFPAEKETAPGSVSFKYGRCTVGSPVFCSGSAGGFFTYQIFFPGKNRWCCAYNMDGYGAAPLCASAIGKGAEDWFHGCGSDGYCRCWAD